MGRRAHAAMARAFSCTPYERKRSSIGMAWCGLNCRRTSLYPFESLGTALLPIDCIRSCCTNDPRGDRPVFRPSIPHTVVLSQQTSTRSFFCFPGSRIHGVRGNARKPLHPYSFGVIPQQALFGCSMVGVSRSPAPPVSFILLEEIPLTLD